MPNPLLRQAAGNAIDTAFGLALEGHNDRRQLRQQEKLNEQQLETNKRMSDYQRELQMQMWHDTNYGAQLEEMKKVGLSPGLMYGQSGGGATTTGGGASGVSATSAPTGGGEIMGMQMMQAQRDLIQAQTRKTQVETENIGEEGIDTRLKESNIANIAQGIKTEQAKQAMLKVQTGIAEIEQDLKSESYEDTLNTIKYQARIANKQLGLLENEKEISDETKKNKISIVEGELIGLGLANEMKKAGIQLTEEQIKKTRADIAQGWKSLSIQEQNALTNIANSKIAQQNADTNIKEFEERARNNFYGNAIAKDALELQKFINNVSESQKLTVQSIMSIIKIVTGNKSVDIY